MAAPKISVLDLTASQVESIERDLGIAFPNWSQSESYMAVATRVLAAATGDPVEKFGAMTLRQIADLVTLEDDSDPS